MISERAIIVICQALCAILMVGCSSTTSVPLPTAPRERPIFPAPISAVTVPDSIAEDGTLTAIAHVPYRAEWTLTPPLEAKAPDGALMLEPQYFYNGNSSASGWPVGPSVFTAWSVAADSNPPGLRTVRAVGSNGVMEMKVFVGARSATRDFVHRIEIVTHTGSPAAGVEIIVRSTQVGTPELTRVVTDAEGRAEVVIPALGTGNVVISEEWVGPEGTEGWVFLYVLLERGTPKRTRFGGASSS